jgi:hypothetical protein
MLPAMSWLFVVLAFVMKIVRVLGWIGVIFGLIAAFAGNYSRARELVISGVLLLVLEFVARFIVSWLFVAFGSKGQTHSES